PALVLVGGVFVGVMMKLFMKAVVMPLLGFPAVNAAYASLTGNPAAAALMLVNVVFAAGFGEEIIWRGFLFERLGVLFRRVPAKQLLVLLATSVLFGAAHLQDQGLMGFAQSVFAGLAFGTAFLLSGSLWLPI